MEFKKYIHLERLGTTEVEGIEEGEVYIFPKIDGTNASIWLASNGELKAGSRTREINLQKDNAGFYAWVIQQDNILKYLQDNPTHRLFGEFLVPHSLRTYRDEAWRNFYVFDVFDENTKTYIHYEFYKNNLEEYGIQFIPPLCIIENPKEEHINKSLEFNTFLIKNGEGIGEGVVVKNYFFINKYGRQTWAKVVTNEFKEKHIKEFGVVKIQTEISVEALIAKEFVTQSLIDKTYAKIENDTGFTNKEIPRLLNTIYYEVIKEEAWNFVKKHKDPKIDFKRLKQAVFNEVKLKLPNLF
jgi:ATP-dependent RNA circularization protein (DNA/RNA ligase family)